MRLIGALVVLCLVTATAAPAAERFAPLDPDRMTPEQKKVADDIVSGPRKSLSGPFNAWLRSPQLADRLQRVGEYLRFHSSVPARLNEFAILITARQWTAQYEWYAHYPLAIKAGLDPESPPNSPPASDPKEWPMTRRLCTTSASPSIMARRFLTRLLTPQWPSLESRASWT